ncbi:hypothetical protein T265_09013 [Opisthorchis viverrini]|uniref:Uncharacterized protein n=1 Tax=Opisthorchis viverrini TaxID=6198 RepID=A0A074ZBL9_OPIVI|nr:hypothetical protein T265_09013 [Opisthorchis viverrini]KER23002.1 hypothetical protein T265_09013 [Opisthorchis viverrini]
MLQSTGIPAAAATIGHPPVAGVKYASDSDKLLNLVRPKRAGGCMRAEITEDACEMLGLPVAQHGPTQTNFLMVKKRLKVVVVVQLCAMT